MLATPIKLALISAALLLAIGCGDSNDNKPPAAAMAPRTEAPPKVPNSVEEKIQAIEKAGLPEDRKKAEIEKVRSGKL